MDAELEEARVNAVRLRNQDGAYLGQIEAPYFSLPNPGCAVALIASIV